MDLSLNATLQLAAFMLSEGYLSATEVDTEAVLELTHAGLVDSDMGEQGDRWWVLTGHGWYRWADFRYRLLGEGSEMAQVTQRKALAEVSKIFG